MQVKTVGCFVEFTVSVTMRAREVSDDEGADIRDPELESVMVGGEYFDTMDDAVAYMLNGNRYQEWGDL